MDSIDVPEAGVIWFRGLFLRIWVADLARVIGAGLIAGNTFYRSDFCYSFIFFLFLSFVPFLPSTSTDLLNPSQISSRLSLLSSNVLTTVSGYAA